MFKIALKWNYLLSSLQMTPLQFKSKTTCPPSLGRGSNPPIKDNEAKIADCWEVKLSSWLSSGVNCICKMGISATEMEKNGKLIFSAKNSNCKQIAENGLNVKNQLNK